MAQSDDGIEEGRIGGLTVRIERFICVGFGDCIELASTPFAFDDEGIATLRPDASELDEAIVVEACRTCPVDALTVIDSDGTQLVP